jgi:hypothetical protein
MFASAPDLEKTLWVVFLEIINFNDPIKSAQSATTFSFFDLVQSFLLQNLNEYLYFLYLYIFHFAFKIERFKKLKDYRSLV